MSPQPNAARLSSARLWAADIRAQSVKFVPSLMAMDPISFATSFYPATVMVLNAAVAIKLLWRRRAVA